MFFCHVALKLTITILLKHYNEKDSVLFQLRTIGAFFTKVLLTSKHRGAFELAYTGFAKLCAVLWRYGNAEEILTFNNL